MRQVDDPAELIHWYNQHPEVHVYGLGDLDDHFWPRSRWYREGNAVVGLVDLPGDAQIVAVYAIAVTDQSATTRLMLELADEIPDGALATAPVGSTKWMHELRSVNPLGLHHKMHIASTNKLVAAPNVFRLDPDDTPDLLDLYASDPGAAFFLPEMLDRGLWAGVRRDGHLVAAGGTHLLSPQHGVAALGGIITRSEARGQGLGGQVTSRLASELLGDGLVVGLNVHADNLIARRMYCNLGFNQVHEYEEFKFGPSSDPPESQLHVEPPAKPERK